MKIVVIGGSGLVGSMLVQKLLERATTAVRAAVVSATHPHTNLRSSTTPRSSVPRFERTRHEHRTDYP